MLNTLVGFFEGEVNTEPSVTEPNQVLSVSEILQRFSLGMDIPLSRGAEYDESDDFEDDPTRDASFDFLDAHIMEQEIEAKKLLAGNGIGESAADDAEQPQANGAQANADPISKEEVSDSAE